MGRQMTGVLLNLAVLTGMLLVVPLGLRLVDGLPRWTTRTWLAGAVPGAVSLWLPRGALATILASGYALATVALATPATARLVRLARSRPRRGQAAREVAVLTALVAPVLAGSALVAERNGYPLLGFALPVLALTVAHFQFAGFAAALVAALVSAATGDGPVARAAALCVPAGIGVVFAGFFTAPVVELAGTVVLTAGMWLAAWLTWREIRPRAPDRVTRALLAVSATVPAGTMLLALSWALGRAADLPHPSLPWMVATHGMANAFGFALCGMLAWQRLRRLRLLPEEPR